MKKVYICIIYNMNHIISITVKAARQIKKIISTAPKETDALLVGVDKSGCSGYAYKLDYAKTSEVKNFDLIEAINKTLKTLSGSFALEILFKILVIY